MHEIERIPQLPGQTEMPWQKYLIDSLLAVGGTLAVTAIIYAYRLYPTIPNISIVYLLIILPLATKRSRYSALLASAVAFLSFDFFLVPPLYTFNISRWEEWIALFVFLVTALIASQLATVSRESVEQAWLHEREAQILYEVGRVLTITDQLDEQLNTIALALERVFHPWGVRECALLLPDANGRLHVQADAPIRIEQFTLSPDELMVAQEVLAQGTMREKNQTSLASQSTSSGQNLILYLLPLKTANRVLGVLCLRVDHEAPWIANAQHPQEGPNFERATFLRMFLDQAILVIEEARLRTHALANNES
ncbi:MAG TPA: DUF4118 domain-containing protein [Ktedonobacteraceae bacterium]|jgi:K+-sensing histidine kinase KdpD|nr:DUF4118 domain-containing protein [Ktedonobacteraceae bacterium]